MSFYHRYYHKMPDGTIKQVNPFTTTEVWCVEERGRKPVINNHPTEPVAIEKKTPESYCHFCEDQYINTPPEKARIVKTADGKCEKIYHISGDDLNTTTAEFRRVGNLFEIVTYDYWRKNYKYIISKTNKTWMDNYLGSPKGFEHIVNILGLKMKMMGLDFGSMSIEEKIDRSAAFFGGCHELLIGRKHYTKNAQFMHDLVSSGELTEDEHYQYIKLGVDSLLDLSESNPFIRYISVFQNWLKPAGASFDHLHKQMVGLDEWGVQADREIGELHKRPNIYNEMAINLALYHSLLIAENDFAVAFAEIGHRYPTVAIYSKSERSRPFDHQDEEIRGMSDMIHAIHSALTNQTPCNEEWYYAPFDCVYPVPWHIMIKLRLVNPAGFEGNTKIYINPVSPERLKHDVVEALIKRREEGLINKNIHIGEEVQLKPNPLHYYKGTIKDFFSKV